MSKRISNTFSEKQIARLSQRSFYPTDDGLDELVKTLRDGAQSEDHAERVITRACRSDFGNPPQSRCPDSNDLWALCRTVPVDRRQDHDAADYKPPRREPCEQCRGSIGFIVEMKKNARGEEYSTARKCPCGAVPSLTMDFPVRPAPAAMRELAQVKGLSK